MHTLQRFLLVTLLTGLVMGCQPKIQREGVEETPEEHMKRKVKEAQEQPEGPQLHP
jgi:hypothetical protein